MCGAISPLIRESSPGKMFIRLDKIIPTGVILLISAFAVEVISFMLYHRVIPVVLGFGLALAAAGMIILSMYKKCQAIAHGLLAQQEGLPAPDQYQTCKLCGKKMSLDSRYCSLCGSKRLHNDNR